MYSWVILTLAGASAVAGARIFQKVLLRDPKSDSYSYSFLFQFFVAMVFLAYTLLTNTFEVPNLSSIWWNVVLMAVFYAVGNFFSFQAFRFAQASEASILFASGTLWSIIIAVIFLGETLSPNHIFGILCIIGGIIVVSFEKSSWKLNKGHLFALLSSFFYGVAFVNDVFVLQKYQSIASYMIIAFLFPALITLLVKPKTLQHVPCFFHSWKKFFVLCGSVLLYSFSSIAIFSAIKIGGKASLVSPLFQTGTLFTVLLGFLFLQEKNKLGQKIIGALITFVGVILLT